MLDLHELVLVYLIHEGRIGRVLSEVSQKGRQKLRVFGNRHDGAVQEGFITNDAQLVQGLFPLSQGLLRHSVHDVVVHAVQLAGKRHARRDGRRPRHVEGLVAACFQDQAMPRRLPRRGEGRVGRPLEVFFQGLSHLVRGQFQKRHDKVCHDVQVGLPDRVGHFVFQDAVVVDPGGELLRPPLKEKDARQDGQGHGGLFPLVVGSIAR